MPSDRHELSAREPIDTRSPDPEALGDRRWPHALVAEAFDSFSIDRGRSPLIDTPGLGSGYPYGTIVRLLILTGQRLGEIAGCAGSGSGLRFTVAFMLARGFTVSARISQSFSGRIFPFPELLF